MRDWNSITSDRYIDDKKSDVPVGTAILDISRDIPSEKVRKRSFDMTFWMTNQSLKNGGGSYRGFHEHIEDALEESLLAGDEVCIVQCQGMMSFRLAEIIWGMSQYFKNNPDKFVVGHIMARKNRYPGLHRQMLAVNLKVWEQLGKPKFEEQGFFWDRKPSYKNFEVSENKLAAEYTPAWIAPAEGESKWTETEDGANWVDVALRNNITIENFSLEMRECKAFLYPYEDTAQLERCWNDLQNEEELDKLKNYTARAWLRKLGYQEFIEKDRVYAFNTERLSAEGVRSPGPIDVFFCAAAGFKPLAILRNNGFHDGTVVNYYDWCESSLRFKKHLLETWNGEDFHLWLLEHDLEYNFSSTYRGNYEQFWRMEVEKEFESYEKFKDLWNRYRKLAHNFYVIDIVNEPEKLFLELENYQGNRVLWTTNIWASLALHWNVEPEELEQKWLRFQSMVPDDLVLYGHDYMARDMQHRIRNNVPYTHPRYKTTNKYITAGI